MQDAKPSADEMYCSNCAAIIKRQAETCVKCGVQVSSTSKTPEKEATKPGLDEMYCSSCGSIIKRQAEICVKCGVRVSEHAPVGTVIAFSDKSRLTAGILGILLGSIGVHRFYLGNIGIGILQIIVSLITFGIGSLWGFIEGIIIVAGGNWKDAQGRPLRRYNE
jgi:TM2 domain-containing membrane protein YozV